MNLGRRIQETYTSLCVPRQSRSIKFTFEFGQYTGLAEHVRRGLDVVLFYVKIEAPPTNRSVGTSGFYFEYPAC